MKRCAAHLCAEPAAALDLCRAHQQLVAQMRLWLAGTVNEFGSTFDADRRNWERAGRP